jgi:Ca-activated chloride channel homolog
MSTGRQRRRAGAWCLLLAVLTAGTLGAGAVSACTPGQRSGPTLRVLASAELADMQPLLADLRRDTGVTLAVDYRAGVDTGPLPGAGRPYDLAWLSSDGYLQLRLHGSGDTVTSTPVMLSPVVIGVTPAAAATLRARAQGAPLTWADIADGTAAGTLRLAMPDPRQSGSGLAALVGVATAAAGTGGALRPEDVSCDRLRGFFSGQTLTAPTATALTDAFVGHQDEVDALIGEESTLLSLNDSGKLRQKLEIVYPADGIVEAQHPLVLLNPAQRAAYDTVVAWLKSRPVQQRITDRTLRRPLDPQVPRDARLRGPAGTALYFPDQLAVLDKLLADYADPALRGPDQVIFVLDFSGSMRGQRIAELRATFAGLSGADRSSSGKFFRFYHGEKFTVIKFGGRILGERDFTVNGPSDLDALRDFIAVDEFDQSTAVWSALAQAYREADAAAATRSVSIVLMTDGENNAGSSLDDFLREHPAPSGGRAVHTYAIRYGEANAAELDRAARATGGRMVDANAASLLDAFKELRGCQ